MARKIYVVVDRGIARTVEEKVPKAYQVEIVDLDLVREGDALLSAETKEVLCNAGYPDLTAN